MVGWSIWGMVKLFDEVKLLIIIYRSQNDESQTLPLHHLSGTQNLSIPEWRPHIDNVPKTLIYESSKIWCL